MADRVQPFDEFFAAYRAEHRHPANRLLHLAAKIAMAAALVAAVAERSVAWLVAVPVLAVAPCWLGHWLFEGNRPTALTRPSASVIGSVLGALGRRRPGDARGGRPWYSFLADVQLCAELVGVRRGARRRAE